MKRFEMKEIGKDSLVKPIPDIIRDPGPIIEKPLPPVLSGMW